MTGDATTSTLRSIERTARAMRYRRTGECIPPADLEGRTDAQLAALLLEQVTSVVLDTVGVE